MAAGLTVDEKNIPVLRKMLNNYADKMDRVLPNLNIDCRIKPHAFTLDTAKALKAFEPYGAANPMPLFATCDCTVLAINSIGQGKHIRLKLRKESTEFWAVMFGVSVDSFPYKIGCVVDVAVTLDVNTYNDTESVSVIVKAIRKSGVDETSFISQLNALEKYQKDDLDKASAVII